MRQFPVACLIETPAARNFPLIGPSPGIVGGQLLSLRFQFIDLAARACLMPIDAPSGEEKRSAHLPTFTIKDHRCNQAMHPPIKAEHAFHRAPTGKRSFGHLHDEVKYRDPAPVWARVFS